MVAKIRIGSKVRLHKVSESLTHDLPVEDQQRLINLVGRTFVVENISHGFYWLSSDTTAADGDETLFRHTSFSVGSEDLELVEE